MKELEHLDKRLHTILLSAVQHDASDIHIKPDDAPRLRINGVLRPLQMAVFDASETEKMVRSTMTNDQWADFCARQEKDYSIEGPEIGRYRVNAYVSRGKQGMVLRRLPDSPPDLSKMGLPLPVLGLAEQKNGLILVCGATGSGKSTTLAGLVHIINQTRNVHVITIEDPIEFVHKDIKASILQREVGLDTKNFSTSLHSALRQDPDVILLGEMRDEETVRTALSASETGHLVLSTLHATSAAEAVNRFLDFFPQEERAAARSTLSSSLRGIVCQRLVPDITGTGRVAVLEVLINAGRMPQAIAEPEKYDIKEIIATSPTWGMQTFDDHLFQLMAQQKIAPDTALQNASNRQDMTVRIRNINVKTS